MRDMSLVYMRQGTPVADLRFKALQHRLNTDLDLDYNRFHVQTKVVYWSLPCRAF